jgi:hypothetical protein
VIVQPIGVKTLALAASYGQRHHPIAQQLGAANVWAMGTLIINAVFCYFVALSAERSEAAVAARMAATPWNATGLYGTVWHGAPRPPQPQGAGAIPVSSVLKYSGLTKLWAALFLPVTQYLPHYGSAGRLFSWVSSSCASLPRACSFMPGMR